MPKILGILREEMAAGFALTGLDVIRVREPAEARDALQEALDGREYGLVIVEEGILEGLELRFREMLQGLNVPLVVSVPARLLWRDVEEAPEDDAVAQLIRRAVGYQLNIQL